MIISCLTHGINTAIVFQHVVQRINRRLLRLNVLNPAYSIFINIDILEVACVDFHNQDEHSNKTRPFHMRLRCERVLFL